MSIKHQYNVSVKWTGNKGNGTSGYKEYDRSHLISIENKPDILGSSDPVFQGDVSKHNPEDLLVSSVSACHMLWYLHLCSESKVKVIDYSDNAKGILKENKKDGYFTEVVLKPVVTVTENFMIDKAMELHKTASERCFISNSLSFPVYVKPTILVKKR